MLDAQGAANFAAMIELSLFNFLFTVFIICEQLRFPAKEKLFFALRFFCLFCVLFMNLLFDALH